MDRTALLQAQHHPPGPPPHASTTDSGASTLGEESDAEALSLTSLSYSVPSLTFQKRPTCRGCNAACRVAFCLCVPLERVQPLFLSFDFTPASRKVWWTWLCISQLFALRFRTQLFGWLTLGCFGAIVLGSLMWAAHSRGFHRGIGLLQLALWIPLQVYIICRLAGLDQDGYDSSLEKGSELWIYAIVEVVTIGLSCLWSVLDVLRYVRGRSSVWGRAHIETSWPGDMGGSASADSYSGEASPHSVGSPTPYASPASLLGRHVHVLTTSAGMVGPDGSPSPMFSPTGSIGGGDMTPEWTPRSRTEHLLSRAEASMREQMAVAQYSALQRLQDAHEAQLRTQQQQHHSQPFAAHHHVSTPMQ